MRVKSLLLKNFKRFTSLEIENLPPAKLIVLAGPNGTGKSSVFEALNTWRRNHNIDGTWDKEYHDKVGATGSISKSIKVEFHTPITNVDKSIYVRTAYRNDPELKLNNLTNQTDPLRENRAKRMIYTDATVVSNYQRLTAQALVDVFENEPGQTTIHDFREKVISDIRDATKKLFPDLILNSLGNPLQNGTFRFDKNSSKAFDYKNLSGGEKAAFDLILDMVVKRKVFDDTVYCIDEPETHTNTRVQGALLNELYSLTPDSCQLWIATHSIGMMRAAKALYDANGQDVVFLDFSEADFDTDVKLAPVKPTRAFWEKILDVALGDLAQLVAPSRLIVCEGNPSGAVPGKNADFDATCYNVIFQDEFPDAKFLSAGGTHQVQQDALKFVAALPKVAPGIAVTRLIDRDDHSPQEITTLNTSGIDVLSRRHLESFLFDDEILGLYCDSVGKQALAAQVLAEKATAIQASIGRGNPPDDVKSAAPDIYVKMKQILGLTGVGNDYRAFARDSLLALISPSTATYKALRLAIFKK